MRSLNALLCAAAAAICLPVSGYAQVLDMTEAPPCAEIATQLKSNPDQWDSIHYIVMWSHGYAVGADNLPTAMDYKAVETLLKNLSEGKCLDPKSSLFAVVKHMAAKKVSDDDAYDIPQLSCADLFKENKDDSGRIDQSGMIADLAWLNGYAVGEAKAPPKMQLELFGAAAGLTLEKCKSSPKLNVATVLEMMMPAAAAALEQIEAAKKAAAPAPAAAAPAPEAPAPATAPPAPVPATAPPAPEAPPKP